MVDTDIETNTPKALLKRMHREQEEVRDIEEGLSLDAELSGESGSKLVQEVISQLDSRITKLIRDDPQCQILLTLLGKMGTKVKRARQLAEKAVMEQLRMD